MGYTPYFSCLNVVQVAFILGHNRTTIKIVRFTACANCPLYDSGLRALADEAHEDVEEIHRTCELTDAEITFDKSLDKSLSETPLNGDSNHKHSGEIQLTQQCIFVCIVYGL